MSYVDLQSALRDWPYEPEKISVRKVLGADGTVRIQMRVELGILQMEAEGRPDGTKPYGCDSLLAYYRKRLIRHEQHNGTVLGFSLSSQECSMLRAEASLYYRRYIALFVLEEYANVVRDTSHSLAIFDLCRDHALEPEDRTSLEEFRAYVLMMDARGCAYHAMEAGETASALAHVNRGIMHIKAHFETYGQLEAIETSEELRILRILGQKLSEEAPQDSLIVTRKALRAAIEQERFEDAARLRDALKNLYHPNA
ncbi:MAG: UvrB/UvrC motif-containing protein [Phycisphaerae bacterium]